MGTADQAMDRMMQGVVEAFGTTIRLWKPTMTSASADFATGTRAKTWQSVSVEANELPYAQERVPGAHAGGEMASIRRRYEVRTADVTLGLPEIGWKLDPVSDGLTQDGAWDVVRVEVDASGKGLVIDCMNRA